MDAGPASDPEAPALSPEEERLADAAYPGMLLFVLARVVGLCLAAVAPLGVATGNPRARADRRRAYAAPVGVWVPVERMAPPARPTRPRRRPTAGPDRTGRGGALPELQRLSWRSLAQALQPGAQAPAPALAPAGPVPGPAAPAEDAPDLPPTSGGAAPIPLAAAWRLGLPLLILAAAAWFYIQSAWPLAAGGFDHNAWEAAALLRGHVFTPPPPAQLDMIHYNGHWASFFPPMPAFILMPLVWLFHDPMKTPVRLFCTILGALCPLFVYQMAERAGLRVSARLWLTALFAFGTVFWYSVDTGTPWYYVHVATVFFYLLALRESFGNNRPLLVGALFGAALLCRNPVALGFPFLFWREVRLDWRRIARFCLPVAIAVAIQLWWNWARTGDILDTGYSHILMGAGFRASFSQGMFSYKHVPWQIYSIFFMAPSFHGQSNFNGVWPYLTLSGQGQSLLLTTPAFLYALEGNLRQRRVWLGMVAVLLTALPQLLYYANGTGQFGNRFSLDYTPLLMALLIFGIGQRFRWQHAVLICASIFLCGYGAVYAGHIHLLPHAWLVHTVAAASAQPGTAATTTGCPGFPWLAHCPTLAK